MNPLKTRFEKLVALGCLMVCACGFAAYGTAGWAVALFVVLVGAGLAAGLADVLVREPKARPFLRWLTFLLAQALLTAGGLIALLKMQVRGDSPLFPVIWAAVWLAGLAANSMLGRLIHRRSPELWFEDQIHLARRTLGEKADGRVQELRLQRARALVPAYRRALQSVRQHRAGSRDPAAFKTYAALERELADLDFLPKELGEVLGQAYVGLGEERRQVGDRAAAQRYFRKARSSVELPADALILMAVENARQRDTSGEAIQAYVDFVKAWRGQPIDTTYDPVYDLLRSLCQIGEHESDDRAEHAGELARQIVEADPRLAWAHLYAGLSHYQLRRPREAVRELEEAARLDARDARASFYLGKAWIALGETAQAGHSFHLSLETDPRQPEAFYWLGRIILDAYAGAGLTPGPDVHPAGQARDESLARAIGYLGEAQQLDGTVADYHYYLGRAYAFQGAMAPARGELERAIELDARPAPYHYELALVCRGLGDTANAQAGLRTCIRIDGQFAPAHRALAELLFGEEKFQESETEYRALLALAESDPAGRTGLGRCLFEQGNFKQALAELDRVATLDREGSLCAARATARIGDLASAGRMFRDWLEQYGPDGRVLYDLGCVYAHQAQWPDALTTLDQSIELTPACAEAYLQRGNAWFAANQADRALEDYRRADALAPGRAAVAYALGRYSVWSGDLEQARREFERAVAADLHLGLAHFGLGLIFERQGDLVSSLQAFEAALSNDVETAALHLRLGVVSCKLGKAETALARLEAARQAGGDGDELSYYMGSAHARRSEYDSAIAEWDSLCARHPEDDRLAVDVARCHYHLGEQHFARSDYAAAIASWERYAAACPGDAALGRALSEAHFRRALGLLARPRRDANDLADARECLQRALGLDGSNPKLRYYLALAKWAEGDLGVALAELEKLAQAEPGNWRYSYHLGLAQSQDDDPAQGVPLLEPTAAAGSSAPPRAQLGATLALANAYVRLGRRSDAAAAFRQAVE